MGEVLFMLRDTTVFVMISCSLMPSCSKHPHTRNRKLTTLVCRFDMGIVKDLMLQCRISRADQALWDEYSVSAVRPDCNFISLTKDICASSAARDQSKVGGHMPLSAWMWELTKATRDGATPMSLLSYLVDRQPCTWMSICKPSPWVYHASA
jgi:hypothetical protein